MSDSVKYRDFVRQAGKYLGKGKVVVIEDREYDIECVEKGQGIKVRDIETEEEKEIPMNGGAREREEKIPVKDVESGEVKMYGVHGCGCVKEGRNLCKKHGRY